MDGMPVQAKASLPMLMCRSVLEVTSSDEECVCSSSSSRPVALAATVPAHASSKGVDMVNTDCSESRSVKIQRLLQQLTLACTSA